MSSETWRWKGHCLLRELNWISSYLSVAYIFIHNKEIIVYQLFIGSWQLWPLCVFQVLLRRKINAKNHYWFNKPLQTWRGAVDILFQMMSTRVLIRRGVEDSDWMASYHSVYLYSLREC
ncbi:uncharacterized protein [Coffea arabica]|uniref:Uncharacterized protein n=1 Tax=Coffea arabica TaxID=13443 RepID=A0ABM4VFK2_COFAR